MNSFILWLFWIRFKCKNNQTKAILDKSTSMAPLKFYTKFGQKRKLKAIEFHEISVPTKQPILHKNPAFDSSSEGNSSLVLNKFIE